MKNTMKMLLPLDIQLFAVGDNNDLPVRVYQRQFKELLTAVFNKKAYFGDFFVGGLQALDGVSNNDEAFVVKTSDIPVVVGTYSTDANTAFGTGTSNSTRFGERTEIIYTNTSVPYTDVWSIHEGIDRHTVNNDFEGAISDRLELQAIAKTKMFDTAHAKFIADSAGKEVTITGINGPSLEEAILELSEYFTDIEVVGDVHLKTNPEVYNLMVLLPGAVREKGSGVNIDKGEILRYFDFVIEKVPTSKLPEGVAALVYVPGIAKAFTGINTMRAIESEDFDGKALQGAGKFGSFITKDNKKAVAKITMPVVP